MANATDEYACPNLAITIAKLLPDVDLELGAAGSGSKYLVQSGYKDICVTPLYNGIVLVDFGDQYGGPSDLSVFFFIQHEDGWIPMSYQLPEDPENYEQLRGPGLTVVNFPEAQRMKNKIEALAEELDRRRYIGEGLRVSDSPSFTGQEPSKWWQFWNRDN